MAHINIPNQVASRLDVAGIVVRIYKVCQKPAVLEAGGDAARSVASTAQRVGKFVYAFRAAWADG